MGGRYWSSWEIASEGDNEDCYNAYDFIGGTLSVDHLLCMAHAFVKFKKVYNLEKDASAQKFIKLIQRLYDLESI